MRQLRVFPKFDNAAEWLKNFLDSKANGEFTIVEIHDSRIMYDMSGKKITEKASTKYAVVYGQIDYDSEQGELKFNESNDDEDDEAGGDDPTLQQDDGFDDGVGTELR